MNQSINNTATLSFVSYFFIVGFTMMTIHLIAPGLITTFENTFGYGFLNAFFPNSMNVALNNEIKKDDFGTNIFFNVDLNEDKNILLPNSVITNYGMNYIINQPNFTSGGNGTQSQTNLSSPLTNNSNDVGIQFQNELLPLLQENSNLEIDQSQKLLPLLQENPNIQSKSVEGLSSLTPNEYNNPLFKDKLYKNITEPKDALLGDFILRKHLIGHLCWMYLSSVTSLLTSISAYGVYALNA